MNNMSGPFYTKKEGNYEPADICKECAFGDLEDNFCCMNPCIYFPEIDVPQSEEDDSK